MDDTRPHISWHLFDELCAVSCGLTDISDKKKVLQSSDVAFKGRGMF